MKKEKKERKGLAIASMALYFIGLVALPFTVVLGFMGIPMFLIVVLVYELISFILGIVSHTKMGKEMAIYVGVVFLGLPVVLIIFCFYIFIIFKFLI